MKINKQYLYQLKADRAEALKAAEAALNEDKMEEHAAKMKEVEGFNTRIEAVEKTLAEQERFGGGELPEGGKTPGVAPEPELSGYEKAVKSFAAAARAGFPVNKALEGMMNEGSDPDGGYTVPEDIVTKILQLRQSRESLLDLVSCTKVTTRTGRRTLQKRSQATPFLTVEEAAKIGKLATPQFTTKEYSIKKRGGYMVVTNELLADSDSNIVAVVQRWLADHDRITANKLILDQIHTKTAQDLSNLDGILKAWVSLGSVFRPTSHLITNDDGLLWLGTLKDGNGRYLLTPNPADPHQLRLVLGPHTLPIKTYDNLTIPTEGGKTPMLLGDLKEGIHFWDRQQMSILVSNVASVGDVNAFEQDLTLWRGLLRNDCTTWDDEAFINGYIKTGVTADTTGGTGTTGGGAGKPSGTTDENGG